MEPGTGAVLLMCQPLDLQTPLCKVGVVIIPVSQIGSWGTERCGNYHEVTQLAQAG